MLRWGVRSEPERGEAYGSSVFYIGIIDVLQRWNAKKVRGRAGCSREEIRRRLGGDSEEIRRSRLIVLPSADASFKGMF